MQERVETQGLGAAKLPQHLCVGPVLLFPVLTALWGAHALEMPQPAQHMPATEGKLLPLRRGRQIACLRGTVN